MQNANAITVLPESPALPERIKTAACLIALLLAYGFVGQMDYENEIRAAASACERQYGPQASFVETADGWECKPSFGGAK